MTPKSREGTRRGATTAERWAALEKHAEIVRPKRGGAPAPAVILFHGCGGVRPFLSRYMKAAAEAGVVAVNVDSYAPRGWSRIRAMNTVCTGLEFRGAERAGDVLAAAWGVGRLPRVDPNRIVLAGWSHGGWAIMDLMTMALDRPGQAGLSDPDPAVLDGVRGLFLAYPYCGPGALTAWRGWVRSPPALVVTGELDRVATPGAIARAIKAAGRCGAQVETWSAVGGTHAFEDDQQAGFSPFRFDDALTSEAVTRFQGFLRGKLLLPA